MASKNPSTPNAESAEATARKQQDIQARQDSHDKPKKKEEQQQGGTAAQNEAPPETGERQHPRPPFPAQHLTKPGQEGELTPAPQYAAPGYRGSAKLEGMTALITGGDSGIGRAVAVLYAREGADVAIVYLSEHADAQETQRLVEAEGRRAITVAGDVKQPEFCREAVRRTLEVFGKLDILVNNAAFQEHAESLLDIDETRLNETLRTNIYGYIHMARAALPHLQPGASVINTGSVTGLRGHPTLIDYSSTKGAIHAFSMSLAANLAKQGVRVNAVAPGPVWTPLNPADQPAEKVRHFGEKTDFGRPAQPEEIAPAYVFLAAPSCASYITGIVLPITGSAGS